MLVKTGTAKRDMGFQSIWCLYWVIGPVLKFLELGLKTRRKHAGALESHSLLFLSTLSKKKKKTLWVLFKLG